VLLEIKDLHVAVDKKEIIQGLSLRIKSGEFHVLMGPNGSGKTTLGKAIMGHPKLSVTGGDILLDGKSIIGLKADERARLGLFMQFQNPVEVEGVGFMNFLHAARGATSSPDFSVKEFISEVNVHAGKLGLGEGLMKRQLNYGLSGGEKKKTEMLQMAVLKPKMAILDEPDSGLDIDAVKAVAHSINKTSEATGMGLLVITHYSRILEYMKPQFAHVMAGGRIVAEGDTKLIEALERDGYEPFIKGVHD